MSIACLTMLFGRDIIDGGAMVSSILMHEH